MKIKKLTKDILIDYYFFASDLYEKSDYSAAIKAFACLIINQPLKFPFWFGLAASLQAYNDPEKSLKAWIICAILDDDNPYVHFHAAECLYILSDNEQTERALNEAIKRTHNDKYLLMKINSLKEHLSIKKDIKIKC